MGLWKGNAVNFQMQLVQVSWQESVLSYSILNGEVRLGDTTSITQHL